MFTSALVSKPSLEVNNNFSFEFLQLDLVQRNLDLTWGRGWT